MANKAVPRHTSLFFKNQWMREKMLSQWRLPNHTSVSKNGTHCPPVWHSVFGVGVLDQQMIPSTTAAHRSLRECVNCGGKIWAYFRSTLAGLSKIISIVHVCYISLMRFCLSGKQSLNAKLVHIINNNINAWIIEEKIKCEGNKQWAKDMPTKLWLFTT